jgi:predicted acylesterase/phospholipase RssA
MSITEVESDHLFLNFDHHTNLDEPTLAGLYDRIEQVRQLRWGANACALTSAAIALRCVYHHQIAAAACFGAMALASHVASRFFHKPSPYLILSIDGGGIRGMLPIQILAHIEEELGRPIGEVFDCIAGTSIGGIIALSLTHPDPENPTKPKMSAAQAAKFLEKEGPVVFERTTLQALKSIEGLRAPKYSNENLKQILDAQFGETRLNQAVTDVLIPSYDLSQGQSVVFFHFKDQPTQKKFLMKDIGMGTAAAPIYFPSYATEELNLVDGGLFANNPALLAYTKAKGHIDPSRDIFILSLGTGTMAKKPIPPAASEKYGMIQWLPKIFDLIFESGQEMLMLHFKQLKHDGAPVSLLRLQPLLHKASQEQLDNGSIKNIDSLKAIATKYFDDNVGWLQREFIQPLKKHRVTAPAA